MTAQGEAPVGASPYSFPDCPPFSLSSAENAVTVTLAPRPRPIAAARRLAAEAFGTFWLVVGRCGAAVLAAGADVPGSIGLVGVSLAFGLTVFTMAFAVGLISSGHFNPAVSVGLAVAGRFSPRDLPGYVAAQLAGATLGGAAVATIASGRTRLRSRRDRARRQRLWRALVRRL
ncbi:hypothetical protein FHY02_002926 [Sphingomonas sp. BK069]|nr:hypothetical protein [Sphingomonas sp. BK069]